MRSISIPLLLALLIASCTNNTPSHSIKETDFSAYPMEVTNEAIEQEMSSPRSGEPPAPSYRDKKSRISVDEKIIKTGHMQVEVADLSKGKSDMDLLVSTHEAYYENEEYHHNDYQSNYSLNIRIPVDQFETFIQELEHGEGHVLSKNISSQNVTEQFIDLEIRQKNKEAYLQQYYELLKKATNIEDLLEIQERIRRLSEEIEATKGRLRYLSDQVGYSTLHLTLVQHHDQILAKTPLNIGKRLSNALKSGLEGAISLLVGLVSVWPLVLIGFLIIIFRGKLFGVFRK